MSNLGKTAGSLCQTPLLRSAGALYPRVKGDRLLYSEVKLPEPEPTRT